MMTSAAPHLSLSPSLSLSLQIIDFFTWFCCLLDRNHSITLHQRGLHASLVNHPLCPERDEIVNDDRKSSMKQLANTQEGKS
ncbi:hypothetical protein Nepgr_011001 [Nepenthes gracilis]|uniref:Uncharacterized protein n=1 Tax=Nepenthes gracilis TaxID=150966 RepID=A0AAD3SEA8_NEPGR|nr:hypothetical protein Nepgr_011001 [Nepenthes gracilis]